MDNNAKPGIGTRLGTCLACRKVKPLCKSHIIQRSLYEKQLKMVTMNHYVVSENVQDFPKPYLYCQKCEVEFSKVERDYTKTLAGEEGYEAENIKDLVAALNLGRSLHYHAQDIQQARPNRFLEWGHDLIQYAMSGSWPNEPLSFLRMEHTEQYVYAVGCDVLSARAYDTQLWAYVLYPNNFVAFPVGKTTKTRFNNTTCPPDLLPAMQRFLDQQHVVPSYSFRVISLTSEQEHARRTPVLQYA